MLFITEPQVAQAGIERSRRRHGSYCYKMLHNLTSQVLFQQYYVRHGR
jgi:hypothetical protein